MFLDGVTKQTPVNDSSELCSQSEDDEEMSDEAKREDKKDVSFVCTRKGDRTRFTHPSQK